MAHGVRVGEIVQVNPQADNWAGCLVIVTEVKTWGIQGFTPVPPDGSMAYIRVKTEEFEPTGGEAVWSDEP